MVSGQKQDSLLPHMKQEMAACCSRTTVSRYGILGRVVATSMMAHSTSFRTAIIGPALLGLMAISLAACTSVATVLSIRHSATFERTAILSVASKNNRFPKCKDAPCSDVIHDMSSEHGDLLYLPYLAPASLRMFLFPDRVASIISTISAGETMNGFFGKCLRLPVTRKDSLTDKATS